MNAFQSILSSRGIENRYGKNEIISDARLTSIEHGSVGLLSPVVQLEDSIRSARYEQLMLLGSGELYPNTSELFSTNSSPDQVGRPVVAYSIFPNTEEDGFDAVTVWYSKFETPVLSGNPVGLGYSDYLSNLIGKHVPEGMIEGDQSDFKYSGVYPTDQSVLPIDPDIMNVFRRWYSPKQPAATALYTNTENGAIESPFFVTPPYVPMGQMMQYLLQTVRAEARLNWSDDRIEDRFEGELSISTKIVNILNSPILPWFDESYECYRDYAWQNNPLDIPEVDEEYEFYLDPRS